MVKYWIMSDQNLPGGVAVVGGLADHVGEIDALAEHVTGDGGLGRGDPQTLKWHGKIR